MLLLVLLLRLIMGTFSVQIVIFYKEKINWSTYVLLSLKMVPMKERLKILTRFRDINIDDTLCRQELMKINGKVKLLIQITYIFHEVTQH